jgi:hypothetical protein
MEEKSVKKAEATRRQTKWQSQAKFPGSGWFTPIGIGCTEQKGIEHLANPTHTQP